MQSAPTNKPDSYHRGWVSQTVPADNTKAPSHCRGKVLIPTSHFIRTLVAARLAADVAEVGASQPRRSVPVLSTYNLTAAASAAAASTAVPLDNVCYCNAAHRPAVLPSFALSCAWLV